MGRFHFPRRAFNAAMYMPRPADARGFPAATCCDHTCNNPLLNQKVVSILSLPGVVSPEVAVAFQAAVEQSSGKSLDEQVSARQALQAALTEGFSPSRERTGEEQRRDTPAKEETSRSDDGKRIVEGFRMEAVNPEVSTERPPSSGAPWWASLLVLCWVALFGLGASRRGRPVLHIRRHARIVLNTKSRA